MYLEREKELDCDILFQEIKKKKKGCDELRNQITLFQWNVADQLTSKKVRKKRA